MATTLADISERLLALSARQAQPAAQQDEREAPPFTGHWRGGNGVISCGTLRIFSENFDTNPADHIKAGIVKWVCDTLNEAQKGRQVQADAGAVAAFERWLCSEMPAGTVIGDPKWWAPRILRAAMSREQSGGNGGAS